jgi:hypothetical protein
MSALAQKQTLQQVGGMSALPQKRTCALQTQMSAKCQKQTFRDSFDYFVGEDKYRIRDRHPDRLCSSEVEGQVELRGLFHG